MRIISGKYKGRILSEYNIDGTRPTMDRVKESLFASIQNNIKNAVCLDLFAGSGSLGIEALSLGSKSCYFVDNNHEVIKILKNNINKIKVKEECKLVKKDYNDALIDFKNNNIKFDIIFLDPPYKMNLITPALEQIIKLDLLNDDGLIICEYENEIIEIEELTLEKEKKYGSTKIKIFRK